MDPLTPMSLSARPLSSKPKGPLASHGRPSDWARSRRSEDQVARFSEHLGWPSRGTRIVVGDRPVMRALLRPGQPTAQFSVAFLTARESLDARLDWTMMIASGLAIRTEACARLVPHPAGQFHSL